MWLCVKSLITYQDDCSPPAVICFKWEDWPLKLAIRKAKKSSHVIIIRYYK